VQNLDAAVKWYSTKLGVHRNFLRSDASEAFLAFSMDDDESGLMLVLIWPGESAKVERHPILFTKKIEAAYNHFFRQGRANPK
jgi:hypothetical protein